MSVIDLIRQLIESIGGPVGIMSLWYAAGFVFLLSRQERARMRHVGLCNFMVDKDMAKIHELVDYGALDDPARVVSLKEVLAS